jgi:hypothetical protein
VASDEICISDHSAGFEVDASIYSNMDELLV